MPINADGAIPNTIMIGDLSAPLYTFTNDDLRVSTLKGQFSQSMISNELPIDTMNLTVGYKQNVSQVIYRPKVEGDKTLETCGWVQTVNDEATVVENTVICTDWNGEVGLSPVPPSTETNTFVTGDVVTFKCHVDSRASGAGVLSVVQIMAGITFGEGDLEITSKTGLFRVTYTYTYGYRTIMASVDQLSPGYPNIDADDELTIKFLRDYGSDNATLKVKVSGTNDTFTVNDLIFNGESVYDNNVDYDYYAGYVDIDNMVYALSKRARPTEKDFLRNINTGTPVWWFCGPAMIAKFFVQSIDRISTNLWTIKCISAIGLLEDQIHVGGIYTGQTFESVFNEIVGNTFSHDYLNDDDDIANLQVFGWLPYDTARNNLHRLLFAYGAILQRNWVLISDDEVT